MFHETLGTVHPGKMAAALMVHYIQGTQVRDLLPLATRALLDRCSQAVVRQWWRMEDEISLRELLL